MRNIYCNKNVEKVMGNIKLAGGKQKLRERKETHIIQNDRE